MLGLYGKCSRALSRHLKGLSSGLPPLERCYAPVGYHTTHVRAAGNEHGKNGRYAYDRDANRVRYKYMLHERCTHKQRWHPAYRVSVKDKVTRTRVPRPVAFNLHTLVVWRTTELNMLMSAATLQLRLLSQVSGGMPLPGRLR